MRSFSVAHFVSQHINQRHLEDTFSNRQLHRENHVFFTPHNCYNTHIKIIWPKPKHRKTTTNTSIPWSPERGVKYFIRGLGSCYRTWSGCKNLDGATPRRTFCVDRCRSPVTMRNSLLSIKALWALWPGACTRWYRDPIERGWRNAILDGNYGDSL